MNAQPKSAAMNLATRLLAAVFIATLFLGCGCSSAKSRNKSFTRFTLPDGTSVEQRGEGYSESTADRQAANAPTASVTAAGAVASGSATQVETPEQIVARGRNTIALFRAHAYGITGIALFSIGVFLFLPFLGGPHIFAGGLLVAAGAFIGFLPDYGVILSPLLFVAAAGILFAKWREREATRHNAAKKAVELDASGDAAGAMNVLKAVGPTISRVAASARARTASVSR